MRSIQDRKAALAAQKLRSNSRRESLVDRFTAATWILRALIGERWTLFLAKPNPNHRSRQFI